MKITIRRFGRVLLLVGLTLFLWAAFFGAPHSALGMGAHGDGAMSRCIFDGKAEKMCTMSISQHLSSWQGLLTATAPEKAHALTLLALLAVAFGAVLVVRRHIALLLNYYAYQWRVFLKQNSLLVIFNPLQEAFSQGILNPKLYIKR